MVLLLGVPPLLLTVLKYAFEHEPAAFQRIGGPLIGLFPFITMFLVTSITMLRERTTGTLERLMTMPLAKLDLLVGYGIAFAAVGTVQALIAGGVAFGLLGLHVAGSTALVLVLAVGNAMLGHGARPVRQRIRAPEFQAVQFMPATVFPQLLLCGLFVARARMARLLQRISDVMPLTYAFDALAARHVAVSSARRGALDIVDRRRRDGARAGARRGDAASPHGVSASSFPSRCGSAGADGKRA